MRQANPIKSRLPAIFTDLLLVSLLPLWHSGYYVDTTGKNTAKIAAYIQNQLKEDKYGDQLTMFGKM